MSRFQKRIAMSTPESEYVAMSEVGKEMVWLQDFLENRQEAS